MLGQRLRLRESSETEARSVEIGAATGQPGSASVRLLIIWDGGGSEPLGLGLIGSGVYDNRFERWRYTI